MCSLTRENEAADILAKFGYDVEQNPGIASTSKNPDYLIDWQVFDCYALQENTSVRNMISQLNNWTIGGLKEVKIIDGVNEVINISQYYICRWYSEENNCDGDISSTLSEINNKYSTELLKGYEEQL